MKPFITIFLINSLFIYSSFGCSPMTSDEFKEKLQDTKEKFFPELNQTPVKISLFKSDAYFLLAQPQFKDLLRKKNERNYVIKLNPKLLDCPPPPTALEAILVHELEHIKDYTSWSTEEIIQHGKKYAFSLKFKANYERQTDFKVLSKSLHEGLASYRNWVYPKLSPKDLKRKQVIYLTPDEIFREKSK